MKKIKHFLLATGLLALSCYANAQTPRAIEWQKSYGGNGPDIAYGGQQTSDGGYIIGGFSGNNNGDITGSLANTNYWVVKTNSAGAIEWQKTLGSNGGDQGLSIVQTADGGYIIVGETTQSGSSGDVVNGHGGLDVLVVKLSSTGVTEWSKTLGGSGDERATSVIQTADGGYAFTGLTSSNNGDVTNSHNSVDYWVVKLTSTGTMSWQKTYGGSGDDRAYCIKQTTDDGYVVTGESNTNNDGDVTGNHGNIDMWVVKINSTGTLQWQKSFGGTNQERGRSIIQTTDGGYAVAGCTNSSNSGDVTGNRSETITNCYGDPSDPWYFCNTYTQDFNDYWVVKLTSTGTLSWQKYFGGTDDDEAYCIIQTSDGGYAISGYAGSSNGVVNSFHGGYDAWIIKTDNTGATQWQKAYGGTRTEYGNSIAETTDGGYFITGATAYGVDGDITFNHGDWDWWAFKLKGIAKSTNNVTICSSALPYIWNGLSLTASGTQTKYFGTDSVAILNLTVVATPITPSVSISTASASVCDNVSATFTASSSTGGSSPVFQWKRNGIDVGSGSSITFLAGTLATNDVISCVMTSNNSCQTTATANSNTIILTVKQSPAVTSITNGVSTITTASLCTLGSTYKYYCATPYGTWSSSNPAVASVSGYSQSGIVAANSNGTATITYSVSSAGCSSTSSVLVTVAQQDAPTAITGTNSVCVNATTALSSTAPVGTTGVWSSSNDRGTINATSGVYAGANAGTWGEAKYTVTNAAGCSAVISRTIIVNAIPNVPTITYAAGTIGNPQAGAPTGGFCVGKVFTVVGTPNVPAGVWSSTGAISVTSLGVVTINTIGAGGIKYTYTSANGCSNSRTMTGTGYNCAARGVNTVDGQLLTVNDFTMYPNPAKGSINLNVETLIGKGSIVVTDLYGKSVKTQLLSMGTNTINVSNLSKGMYFVSVITIEGKTTKKLVVE